MKKAHIISIGNELLIGDTVNTNASWTGSFLTELGFYVEQVITIPDDYHIIYKRIQESFEGSNLTIVTGGLGPTHDDITKKVICDLFDSELEVNENVLNHIKNIFKKRGLTFSRLNADQAKVPVNCSVLFNKQGTAPGMWFTKNDRYLAVLPGVPFEMKHLMKDKVQPKIFKVFPGQEVLATEYFKTAGVAESTLSELIGSLDAYIQNGIKIAYLPEPGGVTVRISTSSANKETAQRKLQQIKKIVNSKAADYIYGKGKDISLSEVLGDILRNQNLTIAAAESCTGGLLSNAISDIPCCSDYYNGSVVAYSNKVKKQMLNVRDDVIDKFGVVSKQVALQMAKGVAELTNSNIGVSTTGIAGPGGGTEEKPVGTVWMGFWIDGKHFALKTVFTNNRLINKERTVIVVMETLRRQQLGIKRFPYELNPQLP